MKPSKPANFNLAVETLERAFGEFGVLSEAEESSLLNKVSAKLLEAFTLLHEKDPELLSPEMRGRVAESLEKVKPRSGRDTFNTGF